MWKLFALLPGMLDEPAFEPLRHYLGQDDKGLKRWQLAGRIAEQRFCDDITSGASDDIKRATQLARTMVCQWGMSEKIGPIRLDDGEPRTFADIGSREYSEATAQDIDTEIKALIDTAYADTGKLLETQSEHVHAVAESLLKYETLAADDVETLMTGGEVHRPELNGGNGQPPPLPSDGSADDPNVTYHPSADESKIDDPPAPGDIP